jgi:hypothetical protein
MPVIPIDEWCYEGKTMTCYIIPLLATFVHYGMRKRIPALRADPKQGWLTMMLGGASVFGVVDHLWNGELFLLGPNMTWDLMLGTTITGAVVGLWALVTATRSKNAVNASV